jgi:hypothetical protein
MTMSKGEHMFDMKLAQCVEMHRDPDATHYTFELDPPATLHDRETRRFRIIDATTGRHSRQIIGDDGSWLQVIGTGGDIPLDRYLARYCGYHESLVSRLRRLRGRWDDLDRVPEHAPYELRDIWALLDEIQRLLVALMSDRVGEALEEQKTEWELDSGY